MVDPISVIVAALALGAAAGLKPTAEQAVKDAYAGIKELMRRKYAEVDLELLEKKPESQNRQGFVAEDLADAGADKDAELLKKAREVIDAVEHYRPEIAPAVGIDLERVKAALVGNLTGGTQARRREAEIEGIKFRDINGGEQKNPRKE